MALKKISDKQIEELLKEELPVEYKNDKKGYYEVLAKKYNISAPYVKYIILNEGRKQYLKDRLWRHNLKKVITKEHAINIISDIYNDYFNKKPDEVKFVDRYSVAQIYILPEKIILQLDEIHLTNLQSFVKVVDLAIREKYNQINEKK